MTPTMMDLYNVVQQLNTGNLRVVQPVTPTSGQTVQMTDNSTDGTLFITPAGTLATLTVLFPTDANSVLGQIRFVGTTQAITSITMSGATILNVFSSMNANDCFGFQKVTTNTWIFLQ
jgi:hypothetical protein